MQYKMATGVDLCCCLHYVISMAKDEVLQIRLTETEKAGFAGAAELAGIPLSSWVRERLRLAAIRELESAGQKIPFIRPIHLRVSHDDK